MRGRAEPAVRKNERIRAREVRLIAADGKQIGVVTRDEALQAAQASGLDLVEISPNARPPVCRITDFGKYMYELSKRQKENKAKASTSSKIKEVKFRVRIDEHDYMTKLRRAEQFLYKGSKLKLSLMFRGREMEHPEEGFRIVSRAIKDLEHVGQPDHDARQSGRHINLVMSPLPTNKRRLLLSREDEDVGEEDEDDDDNQE